VGVPTVDLIAAGLYDPAAPDAADRLALLEWLAEQGATLDEMAHAGRESSLVDLAGALARRIDRTLTIAEVAAQTGLSVERIEDIRFAAGLAPVPPDTPICAEDELPAFRIFSVAEQLFGWPALRRFLQVVGGSLARTAEAAVAMYYVRVEGPTREARRGDLALAQGRYRAVESTRGLAQAIALLFRTHVDAAAMRLRRARPEGSSDTAQVAIGFVDLVGFTSLSRRMELRALATLIERFEETAHDVAARRDSRVVKLVGDEVMFVAPSGAAACDVALTLLERFAGDATVAPRGGLAFGEVLVRGGDYYGPVVNLAARLAELAVPRELLVTAEVAAQAAGSEVRFAPAGRRLLKGFEEPVPLLAAERVAQPAT
jgi:adenylate cyclase